MKTAKFWDRTDKTAIIAVGCLFIVSAIAQLLGAIAGITIVASHRLHLAFQQANNKQND